MPRPDYKPISRDDMRNHKARSDEEARVKRISDIVKTIYGQTTNAAKTTACTSYNFQIPHEWSSTRSSTTTGPRPTDPFYLTNMAEIIAGLQALFPDVTVSHTLLSKGTDGKMYDISKLDDKALAFVNRALDQSFIVIDWS